VSHPLNFGLTDAISRIGGWSRPELPALLEGIQGVLIYGDVSKSVASEVFEARSISSVIASGAFSGIELFSRAPGGLVVEEIDAQVGGTGGVPSLGLNIVKTMSGVNVLSKLDVGGVPTDSIARDLAAVLPFGAVLTLPITVITGGGASYWTIENRTRIWVPPGSFFQVFPVGFASLGSVNIHVTWRELADVQGAP
jgi:hypothetical protein